MEKLKKEQGEALNRLLEEQTPEQCIITMRTAMNAFVQKVCREITPYAGIQYGRLLHPLAHDMARLEAFHTAMAKETEEGQTDAE